VKLSVLTENSAGDGFLSEHGLSYFIERENEKILFDAGAADVFLKNAVKLGLEPCTDFQKIVLSHGHWDHGGGLRFIFTKTLITHPSSFIPRFRKKDRSPVGLPFSRAETKDRFDLVETAGPYRLGANAFFLGGIPRLNSFEAKTTSFEDEKGLEDFTPDDSGLAFVEKGELVVVSGCAHSGICNMVEYARKVTGIRAVKAVIGGFHLKDDGPLTAAVIDYFRPFENLSLYPSHCTGPAALAAFGRVFLISPVKTGMVFDF